MISKDTIATILETVRVDEVISDFVTLKKRGVNLLGNCPFHNEKTPSFTVSPAKGIFKCFGCGKAGNSVNFIMEHEHFTYPEALKYLARKYSISIEEDEYTPEQALADTEKESLYIVNSFAQKYFIENLDTEEGKAVGLSYFLERGFTKETIQKFQLGYCKEGWEDFSNHAIKQGHKREFLVKTGLSIESNERLLDRFRGRVMFPIHSLSGRVIGFGGRVLKADKKAAKYLNSPESEIYHKSKTLYGIFYAKKQIIADDNCYLVEGYTDVISLHQSGIENVVASSGTSLTTDQVRLVNRYTKNITVLYDGDAAGIKASLRGIDMILEEGMNVRVVLFPDGEDPDSYSRKLSTTEFKSYIKANSKDFIVFKTQLLLDETGNDPIKKAGIIRDIVESIAKIPDPITRSAYLKECSTRMEMDEQILLIELNRIRKSFLKQAAGTEIREESVKPLQSVPEELEVQQQPDEAQERDIIRLLLKYGKKELIFDNPNPEEHEFISISVTDFILDEFEHDREFLEFQNPLYKKVIAEYEKNREADENYFVQHIDPEISHLTVSLLTFPYELSENWEKHEIFVVKEDSIGMLKQAVLGSLYALRMRKLIKLSRENQQKLKETKDEEEQINLMIIQKQYDSIKKELSKALGMVVIR